jgi:diguanylate cyclase (GGDEF)-like protein
VQRACADSTGDDPAGAAARLAVGIEELRERGMVTDACMARTFQAIALARSGRLDEALDVIELAGKEIVDEPGWLIRAAIQHTHARLLVEMGSPGAAVVLEYADELAQAMRRERLRTVHAAQTLYEFEQLRSESEALSRSVATDPLTGILNRRGLEARIVEHAACPKGETVAVLALDMDNFKELNDSLGHVAGDRALQRVAQVLGAGVRAGDAVARVGGDGFAALLQGATVESAMGIAERIVAAVAAAADAPASVSVGVAVGCCSDVRQVAEAVDAAMYVAKRSGGGRVSLAPA